MKGEERNHLLSCCELTGYTSIRASLYDTGNGFPAVRLDEKYGPVYGELYRIPDPANELLNRIDSTEEVRDGLFRRHVISIDDTPVYIYEGISTPCKDRIVSGSWLRYGSVALRDPVLFAKNFEDSQSHYYRKQPAEQSSGESVYIPGQIPVLLSAAHSTNHKRDGMLKRYEIYTAAIAVLLHIKTGSHALYANSTSELDPNYHDEAPFKHELQRIASCSDIMLVIDTHGTDEEKTYDLYPGIGINREFLHGNPFIIDDFYKTAKDLNLTVGDENVFPAARQDTVAKYCYRRLGIPSVQIEINKRNRKPLTEPANFISTLVFLESYIKKCLSRLGR